MEASASFFSVTLDEESGRRWRYKLPKMRVALALCLLLAGFCLCIAGASLPSMPCGVAGLLAVVPGGFASYNYFLIWQGRGTRPELWLEVEEL
jgi:hypothetical protein